MTDYKTSGVNTSAQALGLNQITDSELTMIYYLLYSRYGNNPYAADDLYRFKYNLFSTIFMYAPTWLKRLDIQNKLRNLTDDELEKLTNVTVPNYIIALDKFNSVEHGDVTYIDVLRKFWESEEFDKNCQQAKTP